MAGLAIIAAVILALLWISARSSRDDVAAERDAARAEATAEAERTADTADALAASEALLSDAMADNEQLSAELTAAQADASEASEAMARLAEADASIAALTEQNAELAADLATAEQALADAEATPDAPDAPDAPPAFDIAAAPDFARYIGEQVSSTSGPSVLGEGQTTCLGTALIDDIGFEAIGAGLNAGASTSENAAVFEAVERAALSCGIDPSAVF